VSHRTNNHGSLPRSSIREWTSEDSFVLRDLAGGIKGSHLLGSPPNPSFDSEALPLCYIGSVTCGDSESTFINVAVSTCQSEREGLVSFCKHVSYGISLVSNHTAPLPDSTASR